jgi:phenylalanyl-tRNA synthetase alpha chain
MNTPVNIASQVSRKLHLQPSHPISITRQLIESKFPGYKTYNTFFPVVTTGQNFDSLEFPADHPGRSRTDTYYINKDTLLRTHTSAHQADIFRANESDGWLISADVYRRDAIDRSHYPVFHQMEGARTWDRTQLPSGKSLAEQVWADVEAIPKQSIEMEISDPNPTIHPERNPLQSEFGHTAEEVEAVAAHLKRSCESYVAEIFTQARNAALSATPSSSASQFLRETVEKESKDPLRVRWVEAYFPFTSPSWELEVFWQGDWLEVLGSGIVKQDILNKAGVSNRSGWAFGVGLERIAMLLFGIPDIRLFWSQDARFLSQFSAPTPNDGTSERIWNIARFVPFSKHPACPKDVAFWLKSSSSSAGGLPASASAHDFHENDIMELVREIAGDAVEDVRLMDEFKHPRTGRKSLCYRVNYRSLERTLTNEEANGMHEKLRERLVQRFGVELR